MKRVIQKQFGLTTFAKATVVRRSFMRRRKASGYLSFSPGSLKASGYR